MHAYLITGFATFALLFCKGLLALHKNRQDPFLLFTLRITEPCIIEISKKLICSNAREHKSYIEMIQVVKMFIKL